MDRFYASKQNSEHFIRLPDSESSFVVFARGFAASAEKLVDVRLEMRVSVAYSVFPIMYLYRHSLELYLKSLIYSSVRLANVSLDDQTDFKLHNTHKLLNLFEICKSFLEKQYPDDLLVDAITSKLEKVCLDFEAIDGTSFSFRYPIDLNGKTTPAEGLNIDLGLVRSMMSGVFSDIDTLLFGIQHDTFEADSLSTVLLSGL